MSNECVFAAAVREERLRTEPSGVFTQLGSWVDETYDQVPPAAWSRQLGAAVSAAITDSSTSERADFWVTQENTTDAVIVRVGGDIDYTTIARVDHQLHAAAAAHTPSALVVLDLTHVSFLGSDGLSLLITHQGPCAMRGHQLRIVATTSAVLRPITLTGLDAHLSITSTVHEAISAST